jgi:uncharacterized protein (DUF1786 family)
MDATVGLADIWYYTIDPKYRVIIASDVSVSALIAQRLMVVSREGLPTGSDERYLSDKIMIL